MFGFQLDPKPTSERLLHQGVAVTRMLIHYGSRHRGQFVKASLAALMVVATRLALPWPMWVITHQWISTSSSPGSGVYHLLLTSVDPTITMGVLLLLLLVILGLADMIERLYFARFAIGAIRDLRADVFKAARRRHKRKITHKRGDLVARLIGDTARIKNGLKGFFIHVTTHGIVFVGVTVILLVMDIRLGSVFVCATVATGVVTAWGAGWMFRRSLKQRRKEGKLAQQIQKSFKAKSRTARFKKLNKSSGRHQAALTRMEGVITWATHGIYGVTVLAALWAGTAGVTAGRMQFADMVIFMMYALMMRGPIVQLARHGSRTGKIMGNTYRLLEVLQENKETGRRTVEILPVPLGT